MPAEESVELFFAYPKTFLFVPTNCAICQIMTQDAAKQNIQLGNSRVIRFIRKN